VSSEHSGIIGIYVFLFYYRDNTRKLKQIQNQRPEFQEKTIGPDRFAATEAGSVPLEEPLTKMENMNI
jgi:hypothetical protein